MAKGDAVKFFYTSGDASNLPIHEGWIYFVAGTQQLYVGTATGLSLIADHVLTLDEIQGKIVEALSPYKIANFEISNEGDYISDVTLNETSGKLIFAKSDIAIEKGISQEGEEILLAPGESTNVLVNTSVDGKKIIDNFIKLGLSDEIVTLEKLQEAIADLKDVMHFIGVSSTEITDGGRELPTVPGREYDGSDPKDTLKIGDVVIYRSSEFVWTGDHWSELDNGQGGGGEVDPSIIDGINARLDAIDDAIEALDRKIDDIVISGGGSHIHVDVQGQGNVVSDVQISTHTDTDPDTGEEYLVTDLTFIKSTIDFEDETTWDVTDDK